MPDDDQLNLQSIKPDPRDVGGRYDFGDSERNNLALIAGATILFLMLAGILAIRSFLKARARRPVRLTDGIETAELEEIDISSPRASLMPASRA